MEVFLPVSKEEHESVPSCPGKARFLLITHRLFLYSAAVPPGEPASDVNLPISHIISQFSMDLSELRNSIDGIDAQIVNLLKNRYEFVRQVGEYKKARNAPISVPEREALLMQKLEKLNNGVLPKEALYSIYKEIISCGLLLEGNIRVAYLGPPGTWSHQAALKQFGHSVELIPEPNFADIFDAVSRDKANYGVVPVENSTEGAVTAVMDLFVQSPLKICSQIHLRIRNGLISSAPKDRITTIYSHPQILGQTRNWLHRHYPEADIVATTSSTKAAQIAKEHAGDGAAALASPLCAELFGLELLAEDIQDNCNNTTRFAIIGKQETQPTGNDRTSILFQINHKPGTLVKVLDIFRRYNIDLTRIESRPSKVVNWEYVFHVDIVGHSREEPLLSALKEVEQNCSILKTIGSYPNVDTI